MWIIYMILGIVILLLLILAYIFIRYVRDYWRYLDIPHEKPKTLFKIFREATGSEFYTNEEEQEHYIKLYNQFKGTGPFCGFYELLQPRVLVLEMELIRQILVKDFSNFNDHGVYHNCNKDPISGDLYNRNGSSWKEMRLKLDPLFSKEQVQYLFKSAKLESENLLTAFDHIIENQPLTPINAHHLVRRYVLGTIARSVFGLDESLQQKYPLDEFETMTQLLLTTRRHGNYIHTLLSRNQTMGKRMGLAITPTKVSNYFRALIEDVVSQREKLQFQSHDYLQLLIDIKTQEWCTHESDDDDSQASAKKLKDHLFNELIAHAFVFLKSGFVHTAKTISFVLYELAINQELQERVRQEVRDTLSAHDDEFSFECIQKLKFMGQVISETLRMHPVKPFLIRRTLSDYIVSSNTKYFIKKDVYVIIPTQAMHNDPEYFDEPHIFKPERFVSTANKARDQCVWLGFGAGPRSCIGLHFAQLQIRLALARVLMHYKFSISTNQVVIKSFDTAILQVDPLDGSTPVAVDSEDSKA